MVCGVLWEGGPEDPAGEVEVKGGRYRLDGWSYIYLVSCSGYVVCIWHAWLVGLIGLVGTVGMAKVLHINYLIRMNVCIYTLYIPRA